MSSSFDELRSQALAELQQVENGAQLEQFRLTYLTKKGPLQSLLRELGRLPEDERRALGEKVNTLRDQLLEQYQLLANQLAEQALQEQLAREALDLTLPGRCTHQGGFHPTMRMLDQILDVLLSMGFSIHYGPNVDDEYHNFEALNFSPDHPARDMQDTFYLEGGQLLRTQTSNTQVRLMKQLGAPLRVAVPGRCFRNETVTARSHILFHQVEGLYIDEKVSMSDLLATLESFYRLLFTQAVELRVRPSFFPFVEPGIEVDITCLICSGSGCSVCKHSGWLEVAGAGMVHPHVLREGGIDPERYSGFAWGMGVERLLMVLSGVDDIRLLMQGDLRLLRQFRVH